MSLRRDRFLSLFFFTLGLGLAALSVYRYFAPPPAPALEAAATDLEITDSVPGQKREVILRLENHSGRPMRVLGLAEC